MKRLLARTLFVAATAISVADPSRAQVAPSGATATTATTRPGGAIDVTIAAPNVSGISLNQYQRFSVPTAGVAFQNVGINASTIVNQVTSANRSVISGPVSVTGPSAHVVLVNPNGITVDGGSFVNTGGVALSTGSVRFDPTSGSTGVDTVVTTGSSDIFVTGSGLSGSLSTLQLIAGRIKVDGPVVNSNASSTASIDLVAGSQEVRLKSDVVPGTSLSAWAGRTDLGGTSGEILIDVTPRGSVSASRVHLSVGARGAGVSFAGTGKASIGEFTIDAQGRVVVLGGRIEAEKATEIRAPTIAVLNDGASAAKITSISGGVALLANAGDIDITGQVSGVTRTVGDPTSKGGVTLSASANISLLTENAANLAIVFSATDDLSVTAGGNITNDTGRLLSNARTFVTAGGTFANTIDVVGAVNGGAPQISISRGRTLWWWPWVRARTTRTSWETGTLRVPGQLAYVVGSSVFVSAADVINAGEIDAQNGALEISTGSLLTRGSATGSASYREVCDYGCRSWGTSSVGIVGGGINSAGSMRIDASRSIINEGGQIVSYGNLALASPSIVGTAVFTTAVSSRPGGLFNLFSGPVALLVSQNNGGQFLAPAGSIDVTSTGPVVLDAGALTAATGVSTPSGVTVLSPAEPRSTVHGDHIGLFRGQW